MATTYLTPGVYVEEVPSGSATLAPGATAGRRLRRVHPPRARGTIRPTRSARSLGSSRTGPSSPSSSTGASCRERCSRTRSMATSTTGPIARVHRPHPPHRAIQRSPAHSPCRRLPTAPPPLPPPGPRRRVYHGRRASTPPTSTVTVTHGTAGRRGQPADVPRPTSAKMDRAKPVESFSGLTLTPGDKNVETVVNGESTRRSRWRRRSTPTSQLERRPSPACRPGSYTIEPAPAHPGRRAGPGVRPGSETARQGINGLVHLRGRHDGQRRPISSPLG